MEMPSKYFPNLDEDLSFLAIPNCFQDNLIAKNYQ